MTAVIPHFTHLQGCHDVKRETFAALMDLYEGSFMRLRRLIPDFNQLENEVVSSVVGCLDLHLKVLERSKFTTQISMTYYFEREQKQHAEPDLMLRVYHDAGMAEAVSGNLHHGRLVLENLPETALLERWYLNRFLYKWLGYCLHIGHHFDGSSQRLSMNRQLNQILSSPFPRKSP